MPDPQLGNPGGAWGEAVSSISGQGYVVPMIASTTITAKTIVAASTTEGQVVPCAINQDVQSVIGIALNGAAANQSVLVQVVGPVYGVAKSTAAADNFAQFDQVTFSATTTAAAALLSSTAAVTQQKDVGLSLGFTMAAATTAATTVDVFVLRW